MPPPKNDKYYHAVIGHLQSLFRYLQTQGYQNVGPSFRDGAIMIEAVNTFEELASGYYETHAPGKYQLEEKGDQTLFQHTVGPQSFKQFLFPPRQKLWSAEKNGSSYDIEHTRYEQKPMALWGVRDCDLQSIRVLDRIFLEGDFKNLYYEQARKDLFVIAAACPNPSVNCFCTTMGGQPKPVADFDLSLTEVLDEPDHFFVVELGSGRGREALNHLGLRKAKPFDIGVAEGIVTNAANHMSQRFSPGEARQMLKDNPEHPHWDEVARRCLSCANCTMVCPTCFCSSTEDITDITGNHTDRWLRQDSCFNGNHSYIHGGQIRPTTRSRYRQWLTHKLSSWEDQFDMSGCVGCGRCITWCPVGIDLTKEVLAISINENAVQPDDRVRSL